MAEKLTSKERFAFTLNSMDQARRALDLRQVQFRLGKYADILGEITDPDNVAYADIRDGILHLPASSNKLPLTVYGPNEVILRRGMDQPFDDHQLKVLERNSGPYHRRWAEDILRGSSFSNNENDFVATQAGFLPRLEGSHAVTTTLSNVSVDEYSLFGRPIVAFNAVADLRSVAAPVTFHETLHAYQFREEPVINLLEKGWTPEQYATHIELEAYYVTAMVILGIQDAKKQEEFFSNLQPAQVHSMLEVENIRRIVNMHENNPFEPSEKIIHELAKRGFGIHEHIRKRIKDQNKIAS